MELLHVGQTQRAVTLFDESHATAEGTPLDLAGVVSVVDAGPSVGHRAVGALHPRRHVESHHPRFDAVLHAHLGVVGLADDGMFAVERAADGAPVGHLGAPRHGERRRSHGDVLQFAEEIAGVRRLVVSHRFPHHALSVLVVVPERIVSPWRSDVGGIYPDVFVVAGAHDDLLSPVAQDVASGRRSILRPVAVGRTIGGEDLPAVGFHHAAGPFAAAGPVEALLQQVTVPVDAEIVGESRWSPRDRLVGHSRDDARLRGMTDASRVVVGEIAAESASVIRGRLQPIIDFRRCGVAVVHGRMIFVASENLLSVSVGVEVAAVLCVAMSQSCGRESLSVVIDHH